jgi:hypothetical protein
MWVYVIFLSSSLIAENSTFRVRLICKTVNTEQNSTGQNKVEQDKTKLH